MGTNLYEKDFRCGVPSKHAADRECHRFSYNIQFYRLIPCGFWLVRVCLSSRLHSRLFREKPAFLSADFTGQPHLNVFALSNEGGSARRAFPRADAFFDGGGI